MTVNNRTWGSSPVGRDLDPNRHVISVAYLRGQINMAKAEAHRMQGLGEYVPDAVWSALDVSQRAVKLGTTTGYRMAVKSLSEGIQLLTRQYVAMDKRVNQLESQMVALQNALRDYMSGALNVVIEPVTDAASGIGLLLLLGGGALALLGVGALVPVGLSSVALGGGIAPPSIAFGVGLGQSAAAAAALGGITVSSAASTGMIVVGGGSMLAGIWLRKHAASWEPSKS